MNPYYSDFVKRKKFLACETSKLQLESSGGEVCHGAATITCVSREIEWSKQNLEILSRGVVGMRVAYTQKWGSNWWLLMIMGVGGFFSFSTLFFRNVQPRARPWNLQWLFVACWCYPQPAAAAATVSLLKTPCTQWREKNGMEFIVGPGENVPHKPPMMLPNNNFQPDTSKMTLYFGRNLPTTLFIASTSRPILSLPLSLSFLLLLTLEAFLVIIRLYESLLPSYSQYLCHYFLQNTILCCCCCDCIPIIHHAYTEGFHLSMSL